MMKQINRQMIETEVVIIKKAAEKDFDAWTKICNELEDLESDLMPWEAALKKVKEYSSNHEFNEDLLVEYAILSNRYFWRRKDVPNITEIDTEELVDTAYAVIDAVINGVNVSGDVFVIPNGASRLSKSWHPKMHAKYWPGISDDEILIQTWYVQEKDEDGNGSNNMHDHGFHYHGLPFQMPNTILWSIVKDHKEGDIVEFDCISNGITLHCHFKLNQRDYRYTSFGDFDYVAKKLVDEYLTKERIREQEALSV